MITIQSAMLVALGFLAASLLVLIVAPAFWSRAVRLTTLRIKNTMPLSETEIRADKDRVRAEFAVKVHHLERHVEKVRLAAARQMIELNRRDARNNALDAQLARLQVSYEEGQNARRVLEQTIAERLPRVEARLDEAKALIEQRDAEIGELTRTTGRQSRALAEAAAINAQQKSEVERLTTALSTRGARQRDRLTDPRYEEDVALRAELEALRSKTRDQAQLVTRLQSLVGRAGFAAGGKSSNGVDAAIGTASVAGTPQASSDAATALLKARVDEQAAQIARLQAALADARAKTSDGAAESGNDAASERLAALQTANDQLVETVHKLRSELALASHKAARQAEHFTSELKRLGAGSLPASGQPRRTDAARMTLAERVAQARVNATSASSETAGDTAVHSASAATGATPASPAPDAASVVESLPRPKQDASATPANRMRLADRISGIGRSS